MQYSYIALARTCDFLLFYITVYFRIITLICLWSITHFAIFVYCVTKLTMLYVATFRGSSSDFFSGGPMRSIFFLINWMMISLDQWILISNLVLSELSGNFYAGFYFTWYFMILSLVCLFLMPHFVYLCSFCYKNFDWLLPLLEVLR